jgi:hypothetical protein
LLQDAALRARMGAAGRRAAERKFDLSANLDTLMRAYGFEYATGRQPLPDGRGSD